METPQLTFDQWAQAIGSRVLEAIPQASVKRKFEDVYRWTYAGRECQLHAVSDNTATLVALQCGQRALLHRPQNIEIAGDTQADVAARIIGWFTK
ncbi:MAG TPA: hypothetical protein VGZ02_00795 [Candidatus Baltobacteraceae bacterium]|jgi:hypothetical protein|nr:hypothetical protein [Candidatus Baltobacteraceae bacterium]